jgi:hypothetical protein
VCKGNPTTESDNSAHHSPAVEPAHACAAHTSVKATTTLEPTTSAAETAGLGRNRKSHGGDAKRGYSK